MYVHCDKESFSQRFAAAAAAAPRSTSSPSNVHPLDAREMGL
jgi:hypothetical protein